MSDFDKKKVELELKSFTTSNFVRPVDCRNLDQIRFYITELCGKIQEYEKTFDYVPETAYSLLAQYNARQNSMLYHDFVNTY
jgi:hypothetical protein